MPTTKSAKKSIRQDEKKRKRNTIYKKRMRSFLKEARALTTKKKPEEAKELLPNIYKSLDKAAKTGVIKKNAAARNKSRITKLINTKIATATEK